LKNSNYIVIPVWDKFFNIKSAFFYTYLLLLQIGKIDVCDIVLSMQKITLIIVLIFCSNSWADTSSYRCYELDGAKIIAEDGTYLGTLGDSYESDSIYNEYSDHGSTYDSDSIWNEYSDYGDNYSSQSPFNDYASDPPVLLKDGEVVGKLTTDPYEYEGVDPRSVGEDCDWND